MTTYDKESEFEDALCELLPQKGWEPNVLKYPTEEELIQNWADILYENNKEIDKLNGCPLTDGEMKQLLDQIQKLGTPDKLNALINGKTIPITRENPADELHLGKVVYLKIYDRQEIAAGKSRYQIARQPQFSRKCHEQRDRRGDVMLLINGMPIFHIELKKSGIHVSQAYNQIEKYSREGVFTGLFSLVQIFVAMTPEETVYFANPGKDGTFNPAYYFHWADFDNVPVNDWREVVDKLLSIPMAHMMLGFYTVADGTDGVLKVMRSYQYYAAHAISDTVAKHHWDETNQLGGYIWHTTGSGKTMTSFKSAQLIASSRDADKVVFLTDRIELGTQSLSEYKGFAGDAMEVQATEDTVALIDKLKSSNSDDTLIVTSIQKMSRVKEDGAKEADLKAINKKRIVFVVDEAHRSTFGSMLYTIKKTLPRALFFGFTGTPIFEENSIKGHSLANIMGNELHRYTIADGIRDKNVLGFDVHQVQTYKERDLRRAVALEKAKAKDEKEAIADPQKAEIYYYYMNEAPMAGYKGEDGKWVKGIEDLLSRKQYRNEGHREAVVDYIRENWCRLSRDGRFHAILATSSIPEAIQYFKLIRSKIPELKITALYEAYDDNTDARKSIAKEVDTIEVIRDYNERYGMNFSLANYAVFKKDLSLRLAHKSPYRYVDKEPAKQLDLLIVVDQMLTGFDSKWVNTLYLDKCLKDARVIQAFSRTNRLFGPEKPFGNIYYFRKPFTMDKNIEEAVALYSGNRSEGLFVDKIPQNLRRLNANFKEIQDLFEKEGIENFETLPEDPERRNLFAKLFRVMSDALEASKIQGFNWSKRSFKNDDGDFEDVLLDKETYNILVHRYKELFNTHDRNGKPEDVAYPIATYLTEIDTGRIDEEMLNSRFNRYIRAREDGALPPEEKEKIRNELHKAFAVLNPEEQKYAAIFLRDIDSGTVELVPGKGFKEYIADYIKQAKNDRIHRLVEALGLDEAMLRQLVDSYPTKANLDLNGRFTDLSNSVNFDKAKAFFEAQEHLSLLPYEVNQKKDALLRAFVLSWGEKEGLVPDTSTSEGGATDKKEPLDELMERINEAMGGNLTEADKVAARTIIAALKEDTNLAASAQTSKMEEFRDAVFKKTFENTAMDGYAKSMESFEDLMQDDDKRDRLRRELARELYFLFRREYPTGDDNFALAADKEKSEYIVHSVG